jgi:hypothetical protein
MKGDCQWFNSKIEGYFCDSLNPEELECAGEHLRSCLNCRNEVQALLAMDPLVKQLFEFRMEKAQAHVGAVAPGSGMWLRLGFLGATLSVAALLMFAVFSHETQRPETTVFNGPAPIQSPPVAESPNDKIPGPGEIVRAKTDAPDEKTPAKTIAVEPPIPLNAPEFQIMNAEGYSKSLQDYRGRILLVGIWTSEQPEAAENLQQIYQAFGARTELRILGVSRRNQDRLPNTTFPVFFNNGSRLFDARNSEFVIVDKESKIQMRGELTGDSKAITAKVKAKLDQLGAR